jgi:hypothetical protein
MATNRFYRIVLGDPDSRTALWFERTYGDLSDKEIEDIHFGKSPPPDEYCIHVMSGRNKSDGVGSTGIFQFVSDRVIKCLLDIKATGWTSYPVKVVRKNGDLRTGYNLFAVSVRWGVLDAINAITQPSQLRPDSKKNYYEEVWV